MPKVTESKFTINGKSGKEYRFNIYSINTEFKQIGGIYVFTKRYLGSDQKYYHQLIYCGKTADLSTRFSNHHKIDCCSLHQANCLCVMTVSDLDIRTQIETDILTGKNFKCNDLFN